MIRLHPIAVEQEVPIHVKIAGRVPVDFRSQRLFDLVAVQELGDPSQLRIAKVFRVFAFLPDIIHVLPGSLVRTHHHVVAINRSRDARPYTFAVIAVGNKRLATRQGIIHLLTAALIEDGGPATLPARHGPVVCVLSEAVRETVPDQNRFEIDVPVLVAEYLGREDRNVMACVGLSGDVKVLVRVLRKLLEEQAEQRINIFARGHGVADGSAAVRIPGVDGLIEEDDGGVGVPRVRVVRHFDIFVDR